MKNPKVMVVQMQIIPLKPIENFEKIKNYFKIAKSNSCDFIVFPEKFDGILSPTEYLSGNTKKLISAIQKLCRENEIYCVAGSLLDKRGEKYYNSSYLIDKNGRVLGRHDKLALSKVEKKWTVQGQRLEVFETEFCKVGILICRDFMYPEFSKKLSENGAKIIFCPTFWSYDSTGLSGNIRYLKTNFPTNSDSVILENIPRTRAIENESFFIVANAAGIYEDLGRVENGKVVSMYWKEKLAGYSSICAPLHGTISSLKNYDQGYLIQELNLDILEDSTFTYALKSNSPEKIDFVK